LLFEICHQVSVFYFLNAHVIWAPVIFARTSASQQKCKSAICSQSIVQVLRIR